MFLPYIFTIKPSSFLQRLILDKAIDYRLDYNHDPREKTKNNLY